MRSIVIGVALVLACGGEQGKSEEPQSPTPPTLAPVTAQADAAALLPIGDTCVANCVSARQMQATSPEQIERDCQALCQGTGNSEITPG